VLARFHREARLAMKLKHAYVVRTFQAGETDGLHHIVMEYLDGETLEDVIRRRGKLAPDEVVRLGYQALLGLHHVHEQGMIHRDVKPGNLMLVGGEGPSTRQAIVKLLDIGLGKALFDEGSSGSPDTALTNEGSLLGTPDYMAPEQARSVQTADSRADIYSLGCTLYQALAGQLPFPETNLVRLLMRHASEPPRPLSQLNPAVSAGLQQTIERMMAKDPAQRYPTADQAAEAVQAFLTTKAEAPAQPGARMQAYLEWLDSQSGEVTVAVTPAGTAARPVTPEVVLVPVAAEQTEAYPKAAPEKQKRTRLPEARPAAAPARKSRLAEAPRKKPRAAPVEKEPSKPAGLLNGRDVLMIGLGGIVLGVVVLLIAGIVYALTRLLG
jgi:hypothetical protein